MAFLNLLKNIKNVCKKNKHRLNEPFPQQKTTEKKFYCEDLEQIRIKDAASGPNLDLPLSPDQPPQTVLVGAFYALAQHGLSWLVKVLHQEKGLVHYLRYAGPVSTIPRQIEEATLSLTLDPASLTFGAEHLALAEATFLAQALFLQEGSVTEADLQGYTLYVDSLFDCLHEQAPSWLQKVASHAAWNNDRKAMTVLVDRYLLGAELPRDSKKALYWLNRLVQQEQGRLQPGSSVEQEEDILIGGLYGWKTALGTYTVGKVVLKDQEGVQYLRLPLGLEALPDCLTLQESMTGGEALSHSLISVQNFLHKQGIFLGLLPITVAEMHSYRNYLLQVVPAFEVQPSAFEYLHQRAEAGEGSAQYDLALLSLYGDPAWEVPQDLPTALHWFTQAANQGSGLAAYQLALLSQKGADCMDPDPQLYLEWLLYAARLNCGLAQYQAGEYFMQDQDRVQAYAWYSIALNRSDNGLKGDVYQQAHKQQQLLEAHLSAPELAQARELAQGLQASFLSEFSHKPQP
jgi:TPR repeat protein